MAAYGMTSVEAASLAKSRVGSTHQLKKRKRLVACGIMSVEAANLARYYWKSLAKCSPRRVCWFPRRHSSQN